MAYQSKYKGLNIENLLDFNFGVFDNYKEVEWSGIILKHDAAKYEILNMSILTNYDIVLYEYTPGNYTFFAKENSLSIGKVKLYNSFPNIADFKIGYNINLNTLFVSNNSLYIAESNQKALTRVCKLTDRKLLKNITYKELVELRDTSKLIPGCYYKITDYICTTTQTGTKAGTHTFDIIVLALSSNELSEEAQAASNIISNKIPNYSAWKLWYCLDNDTNRFAWADKNNGKGVIYRMIDEYGNDCPYDFKNIQFQRFKMYKGFETNKFFGLNANDAAGGNIVSGYAYTFNLVTNFNNDISISENTDASLNEKNKLVQSINFEYKSVPCCNNKINKYTVLQQIDNGSYNEVQYLNNIVFLNFYNNSEGYNNIQLSKNNTFGYNCYDCTFGHECCFNTIGNNCYNIKCIYWCYNNIIGNDCYDIIFNTDVNSYNLGHNIIGNNCYKISFDDNCNNNTITKSNNIIFGFDCIGNTIINTEFFKFGNGCTENSISNAKRRSIIPQLESDYSKFGNSCCNNVIGIENGSREVYNIGTFSDNLINFGNGCNGNILGIGNSIGLGNNCIANKIGNHNQLSLGDNCRKNDIGNYNAEFMLDFNCEFNKIGNWCNQSTIYNNCTNNIIGDSFAECTFEANCSNNVIGNFVNLIVLPTRSYSNKIGDGCKNINFRTTSNVIIHNNYFEDNCKNLNIYANNPTTSTGITKSIMFNKFRLGDYLNNNVTINVFDNKYPITWYFNSKGFITSE